MKKIILFCALINISVSLHSNEMASDVEKTANFSSLAMIDQLEFAKTYCENNATIEIQYQSSINHLKSIVGPEVLELERPEEYKHMIEKMLSSFEFEVLEPVKQKGKINIFCSKMFENTLKITGESLRASQEKSYKEYKEKTSK